MQRLSMYEKSYRGLAGKPRPGDVPDDVHSQIFDPHCQITASARLIYVNAQTTAHIILSLSSQKETA